MISRLVLDHLWQSTLLALAAGLLTLALRRDAARVRYWVWFAASLKFLIPFQVLMLLGSQFHWRHLPPSGLGSTGLGDTLWQVGMAITTPQIALRYPAFHGLHAVHMAVVLYSIWALGCATVLARWTANWSRMRATVREAVPAEIPAPVPVRFTRAPLEPGVMGILRPILVLPAGINERLTPAQLQAVISHELCHIRRCDNLTAAVHMLLEAAFWFHPLIWWIGARLVEERERACDEAVLELGNDTQTYAEGILRVCRFYVESKLACVAGVSGAGLKNRIEVIMSHRVTRHLDAPKKLLLATAVAAAIVIPIALGMAGSSPARAQVTAETGSAASVTFDSVSIAAATASSSGTQFVGLTNGTWTTTRVPLRDVIAMAYGVDKSLVVGGPGWLDKPLYDITAHSAAVTRSGHGPPFPPAPMIKALLVSRFGLVTHSETQDLSVYTLRVDAGGSKLNPSFANDVPDRSVPQQIARPMMIIRPNVLISTAAELKALTSFLAQTLGHPVMDETGLKGRYDFAITGPLNAANIPAELREQLGLTVELTTAPVDVIVVDGVQTPTLDSPATPGA